MIPIAALRARVLKLEAGEPSPVRKFIVVVRTTDKLDRPLLAALEAKGEVLTVSTGVPRDLLDAGPPSPVVYEQAADGRWIVAEPEALAA
jgi:hypothetical protein